MEPHISRDGNTLFFNNLNSPNLSDGTENDTNIHYASRIDNFTFQYVGEVAGANTDDVSNVNELEGVASIDKGNKFYFVNTVDYLNSQSHNYLRSLFQADFASGILSNIQSLPNLKAGRPAGQVPVIGELNFDAEIHCDGEVLYFVEGIFSGNPFPDEADIAVATKLGGVFTVNPDSNEEFAAVNTADLEYAPAISSNRLELFFSRATGSIQSGYSFGIYIATRNSVSEPWGNIKLLEAAAGDFSEGPSISADGKQLYYHQKKSGIFKISVMERL